MTVLKMLADAFDIRARVIGAFERAERALDDASRDAWMTFAVIGGGPTGVEMAGTMSEIAQHTLSQEFRRIDSTRQAENAQCGKPDGCAERYGDGKAR